MLSRIIESIQLAFSWPGSVPDVKANERFIIGKVIRRFSHGNVRLQRGDFSTKEDIDQEYEKIKSLNFDRCEQ